MTFRNMLSKTLCPTLEVAIHALHLGSSWGEGECKTSHMATVVVDRREAKLARLLQDPGRSTCYDGRERHPYIVQPQASSTTRELKLPGTTPLGIP